MRRLARPLLYLGVVGVVLGMSKLHASEIAVPAYDYTGSSRFAWSIGYMTILALSAYGMGLPDLPRTTRAAVLASAAASIVAGVAMSVLQAVVGTALLPRFVVFGSALMLVPWYMTAVAVSRGGRARDEAADQVILVGDAIPQEQLAEQLRVAAEQPASIVRVLTIDNCQASESTLIDEAERLHATVVVLDRDAQAVPNIVAQAALLHATGVRVRTLTLFSEQWLGKTPVNELERVALLFDIGEIHRSRYGRLKRLTDLVMSLAGCVALLALVPFVVLGNLLGNRGPLMYRQERIGKDGQPFQILKLRTMRPERPEDATTDWTAENDPRITPFGHILRVTHLDELPQVMNIVRGELSVVGPRPEQTRYVEELRLSLPFYDVRHLVRPGLTGWAQVKYGYASDQHDALEKLQYEIYYLRHQRLTLDARILFRTIRSVLGRGGR